MQNPVETAGPIQSANPPSRRGVRQVTGDEAADLLIDGLAVFGEEVWLAAYQTTPLLREMFQSPDDFISLMKSQPRA
jgi:hypothetical protein